jgi:hypothetical protein
MDDELKKLLPGESYPLPNGETVMIRPVPFGKLRVFSEAVASFFEKLQGRGQDKGQDKVLKLESVQDYKTLFDTAAEEVLGIMALVLDKPREWFDTIDIPDGLGILAVIVEQNLNERAKKNLQLLLGKFSSLSQTASRPSSSTDTPLKKSKAIPSSRSDASPTASPS